MTENLLRHPFSLEDVRRKLAVQVNYKHTEAIKEDKNLASKPPDFDHLWIFKVTVEFRMSQN